MTGNEMVGWHHQLDGHESEQALGVDDGQGSLACCSPWGHKESCPTLCDPMNRSMPGFPVHHQLLEFTQNQVLQLSDAISSSVIPFSS